MRGPVPRGTAGQPGLASLSRSARGGKRRTRWPQSGSTPQPASPAAPPAGWGEHRSVVLQVVRAGGRRARGPVSSSLSPLSDSHSLSKTRAVSPLASPPLPLLPGTRRSAGGATRSAATTVAALAGASSRQRGRAAVAGPHAVRSAAGAATAALPTEAAPPGSRLRRLWNAATRPLPGLAMPSMFDAEGASCGAGPLAPDCPTLALSVVPAFAKSPHGRPS
jgi:hypothetical protein